MEFIVGFVIFGAVFIGLVVFFKRPRLAGTWHDGINEVTHRYWRGHKAIHAHGVTGLIKAVDIRRGGPHVLVVRDDNGKEEHWPAWIVRDEADPIG